MKSSGVAYLLWLLCFFGLCGMHRFYAGKPISGLIWLFTFGLLGFGQLIDLILIPSMIDADNLKLGGYGRGGNQNTNTIVVNVVNENSGRGRRCRKKSRRYDDDDEDDYDD